MRLTAAILLAASSRLAAETPHDWKTALPGVDPNKLSGGLYSSLADVIEQTPQIARVGDFPGANALPQILDARIGANAAVGSDPSELPVGGTNQAEPHIMRSAIDPDFLVATFQEGRYSAGGGGRSVGYGVSHDGGLTWTRALIPGLTMVSGGPYFRATDPVAGIDRSGNIYLNVLTANTDAFGVASVLVCKSTDGGITFPQKSVVFQQSTQLAFPDKNWMAVNDYPSTFSTGRILATWTNFTSNSSGQSTGNNIVAKVSNDGGSTWGPLVNVTALGTSKQGSQPMFFSDGTAGMAYITFLPSGTADFRIEYQQSADGGATWPGPEISVASFAQWDDPLMRDGTFIISAANARTSGRIVIAATALVFGAPTIYCYTSTNRGQTWTGPFVVSDNSDTESVFNPAIAISDDGQTVSAIYYQRPLTGPDTNFLNIRVAHSFDGGHTWSPSIRVTDVATDATLAQLTATGYMLGDYQGLAPPAGPDAPPVALWIDTRNGGADPFTARVVPTATPDYNAWRRASMSTAANNDPAKSAVTADPDNDGLPNGIEYPLATSPTVADFATPFGYKRATGPEGAELVLSHPLRPSLTDVTLAWDSSTDGTNWTPTAPRTETSEPIREGTATLVTSTHPLAGVPERMFRLHADVGASSAPSARRFATSSGSRLVNLSTRGNTGSGEQVLIGGFATIGTPDKQFLIRGAGPALTGLVSNPLADPRLDLFALGAFNPFASNDNWETPDGTAIAVAATKTGAFAFGSGSKDSALLTTPGPGGYTAQVSGVAGATGIALVEIYDANTEISTGRLVNISTRGQVGMGENNLTAGFFIAGTAPKLVLVRAVGATLGDYGVHAPLPDPELKIFRAGENTPIASIDNWGDSLNPRAASDAALISGAFTLPDGSTDASFLLQLPPGGYTAQVNGVGGLTGVALVEVYEVN